MEKSRGQNSLVLAQVQELGSNLLLDFASHHPHLKTSILRDRETFLKRLSSEGMGFATSSLPRIGKAIYRSFETGTFRTPEGFRVLKGTSLPRFLGGLMKECYEDNGCIRRGDLHCIVDLIQFCFFFYKLELPYSTQKVDKVITNFKEVEVELSGLIIDDVDPLIEAAVELAAKVLAPFSMERLKPKHGPGAVATREKLGSKWEFSRKYESLHKVFPYYEYFVPSRASLLQRLAWYKSLDTSCVPCARVSLVSKDARGPRLISMEPLEFQFIQQSLKTEIVDILEHRSPYTRGYINFTDQGINRTLAKYNSLTRRYATLDMKEASDRVTVQLVKRVFAKADTFLKAILASRTHMTELPNGEIVHMHKFAPMGSATCFPVEALVFWLLAEVIRRREGIKGRVYVYGDDIIVPSELSPFLFKEFPKYGLKFNEDKCFVSGYFRESCGLDAYKGIVCTPVRMRKEIPSSKRNASSIVSAIELSNHLWEKGYWRTALAVESAVKRVVPVDVLRSPRHVFGGLSFVSFTTKNVTIGRAKTRFNTDYQCHEAKVHTFIQKMNRVRYTPDGRLFANLVGQLQMKAPVPHAGTINLRWKTLN